MTVRFLQKSVIIPLMDSQTKPKKIKIFIGLPVTDDVANDLCQRAQENNQKIVKKYRWVKERNAHITLFFLGYIEKDLLASVLKMTKKSADVIRPFTFKINEIVQFPNPYSQIIAASIKLGEMLEDLYNILKENIVSLGFKSEYSSYRPHITLARARGKGAPHIHPILVNDVELSANEIIVYESHQGDDGSNYIPIERYPLLTKD